MVRLGASLRLGHYAFSSASPRRVQTACAINVCPHTPWLSRCVLKSTTQFDPGEAQISVKPVVESTTGFQARGALMDRPLWNPTPVICRYYGLYGIS